MLNYFKVVLVLAFTLSFALSANALIVMEYVPPNESTSTPSSSSSSSSSSSGGWIKWG